MPEQTVLYGSALLNQPAYDLAGQYLGRVADVIVAPDATGRPRLTEVVVTRGLWGRLLGYERDEMRGPWVLEAFARAVLRRDMHRLPWSAVRIGGQPSGPA
jgi:PRC-barrel domain protein